MKNMFNLSHCKSKVYLIGLFFILWMPTQVRGQKLIQPKPKSSPLAMATYLNKDTYLKVTYGQPMKKGRDIFGNLVPYGQIWRTGANEATEFTVTKDVKIDKKVLKAGTYTLFTIPDAEKWTIILNGVVGQWGAYNYDEIKNANVLEIKIPVSKSEDEYEAFTIQFEEKDKGADMILLWDTTKINIPITFNASTGKNK